MAELGYAQEMAGFTADKLDTVNAFYQQFFGEEQRRNTALIDNTKRVFGAISENLKEGAEMNINIACEFTHSCVQIKTKVGMPSGTTGKMGSTFASSSSTTLGKNPNQPERKVKSTDDRLAQRKDDNSPFDIRYAHWSRGAICK